MSSLKCFARKKLKNFVGKATGNYNPEKLQSSREYTPEHSKYFREGSTYQETLPIAIKTQGRICFILRSRRAIKYCGSVINSKQKQYKERYQHADFYKSNINQFLFADFPQRVSYPRSGTTDIMQDLVGAKSSGQNVLRSNIPEANFTGTKIPVTTRISCVDFILNAPLLFNIYLPLWP